MNSQRLSGPDISLRMKEGYVPDGDFEWNYLILEHMRQESSFPPFNDCDTHICTVRVRHHDTSKAKRCAKKAIQSLMQGAIDFKMSGHRRGVYVYVNVTFRCSIK